MYNILLVGTAHSKNGKCNSDELYKIIEYINPEVIFDERPSNCNPETLEKKCIEKYKQNHNIEVVPVDIYLKPKLSELYMFAGFIKHSEEYREIINEQELLIAKEGFDYLNSAAFCNLLDKKRFTEKRLIESNVFFKEKLLCTYNLHLENIERRENAMIQNVYNYSKENEYNQAVFIIGAEHRKSIMQKIIQFEKMSKRKINWMTYSNKIKVE